MMFNRNTTALQFSGGKDSMACLYLLRDQLENITVYHVDSGDKYPEVAKAIDRVREWIPNFVTIQSDVAAWQQENGIPSDIVPTTATFYGNLMGFGSIRLVDRFSCCFNNLMLPMYQRMKADGMTTIIRGTKKADMPTLPCKHGDVLDGFTFLHPVEDWTHQQVLDYLREVGAPVPSYYDDLVGAPDCPSCTAWWTESRADFLKRKHPGQFANYISALKAIRQEIAPALALLDAEIASESMEGA